LFRTCFHTAKGIRRARMSALPQSPSRERSQRPANGAGNGNEPLTDRMPVQAAW